MQRPPITYPHVSFTLLEPVSRTHISSVFLVHQTVNFLNIHINFRFYPWKTSAGGSWFNPFHELFLFYPLFNNCKSIRNSRVILLDPFSFLRQSDIADIFIDYTASYTYLFFGTKQKIVYLFIPAYSPAYSNTGNSICFRE